MNIPFDHTDGSWIRFPLTRLDFSLAIVFVLLALALRWPFIVRGNTLLLPDEAIVGIMAQDISEGRHFPIYFYGQRYMGALEAYTMAALLLLIDDPFLSLRLAPAFYFSLLVGTTFLMMTRWFGRLSGAVSSIVLIAASPMFVQWSIAPRGGYIEVLLWGVLLWWAYSEWFVQSHNVRLSSMKKFLFGLLVGSGLWLNPMFLVYLLPVFSHIFFSRSLQYVRYRSRLGGLLTRLEKLFRGMPLALPVLGFAMVLMLNCIWAAWATEERTYTMLILNLLSHDTALTVVWLSLMIAISYLFICKNFLGRLLGWIEAGRSVILGILFGYLPSMLYVVMHIFSGQPLENALLFGIRPIWTIESTLSYFWSGLPVFFGADPEKYLQMNQQWRQSNLIGLNPLLANNIALLNWIILCALSMLLLFLVLRYRHELAQILQMQPVTFSTPVFLLQAVVIQIGLYVFSGAAYEFSTIRYMLPLWSMLPALLGASVSTVVGRWRQTAYFAVIAAITSWSIGQVALYLQLGRPHPLEPVATALQNHRVRIAGAEILDAHILSFLTQQNPKIFEYRSFWPRLSHYLAEIEPNRPIPYIVNTDERDWISAWIDTKFPGSPPVDNQHYLYTELRQLHNDEPHKILLKEKLYGTWELWLLDRPLPD